MSRILIAVVAGVGLSAVAGLAQGPVRTTAAGVLIDVTVLDRDGRPVLQLAPDDFELTENGTKQRVLAPTLVKGGA